MSLKIGSFGQLSEREIEKDTPQEKGSPIRHTKQDFSSLYTTLETLGQVTK